jgi:hypothetical protein
MGMAKLSFGRLSEAWRGEAADFTPLLAAQLDSLGDAIGVDLTSLGQSEVSTAGGRRIDIVAQVEDGSEFVIENQYGRADHDHLTRGLAYAVARHANGLVVVAFERPASARRPPSLATTAGSRRTASTTWLATSGSGAQRPPPEADTSSKAAPSQVHCFEVNQLPGTMQTTSCRTTTPASDAPAPRPR